jgi:uncharacterized protein (UPF0333 family)
MIIFERERTSAEVILYALYLYFLGLSFRNTSKATNRLKKKEEAMLLYGNGSRDLIQNVFTVVKEYLLL